MTEERRKRLTIAEKRALSVPLTLGPQYQEFDPPDRDEAEPEWMSAVEAEAPPKTPISLRVDPDVLEFFRSHGPGYQTRMNAVLRGYMQAKKTVRRP